MRITTAHTTWSDNFGHNSLNSVIFEKYLRRDCLTTTSTATFSQEFHEILLVCKDISISVMTYVRFGREWVNIEITEDTDPKKIFTFYVYLYYECYFTKLALTLLRYVQSLFKAAVAP